MTNLKLIFLRRDSRHFYLSKKGYSNTDISHNIFFLSQPIAKFETHISRIFSSLYPFLLSKSCVSWTLSRRKLANETIFALIREREIAVVSPLAVLSVSDPEMARDPYMWLWSINFRRNWSGYSWFHLQGIDFGEIGRLNSPLGRFEPINARSTWTVIDQLSIGRKLCLVLLRGTRRGVGWRFASIILTPVDCYLAYSSRSRSRSINYQPYVTNCAYAILYLNNWTTLSRSLNLSFDRSPDSQVLTINTHYIMHLYRINY